jgi:hypothetical protein
MGSRYRSEGLYLSPVKDTETTSRWGTMRWRADVPEGTELRFATRSGNTSEPDETWSAWAAVTGGPDGAVVDSPRARFAQWRAELVTADPAVSPSVYSVDLVYAQRNLAPVVTSFVVHPAGVVYRESGGFDNNPPYSELPGSVRDELARIDPSAAGSVGAGNSATSSRALLGSPYFVRGLRTLTWAASDPNGDALDYALEFRGEGEATWKPLDSDLDQRRYVLETSRLVDGAYRIRIAASDAASNPPETALVTRETSVVFRVDNTPPAVDDLKAERDAGSITVSGRTSDATSLIRQVEYSVDGGDWVTVVPVDGLADSDEERIAFRVDGLGAGEHTIVVRVTDEAYNRGSAKVVVETR